GPGRWRVDRVRRHGSQSRDRTVHRGSGRHPRGVQAHRLAARVPGPIPAPRTHTYSPAHTYSRPVQGSRTAKSGGCEPPEPATFGCSTGWTTGGVGDGAWARGGVRDASRGPGGPGVLSESTRSGFSGPGDVQQVGGGPLGAGMLAEAEGAEHGLSRVAVLDAQADLPYPLFGRLANQ